MTPDRNRAQRANISEIDAQWLEVRDSATGRLLFLFDPRRLLIQSVCVYWDEVANRRRKFTATTDLTRYAPGLVAYVRQPDETPATPVTATVPV